MNMHDGSYKPVNHYLRRCRLTSHHYIINCSTEHRLSKINSSQLAAQLVETSFLDAKSGERISPLSGESLAVGTPALRSRVGLAT